MSLLRHCPGGPLGLHVAHLWTAERAALPHRLEFMLPTGCADLVIPLHDEALLRAPDGPLRPLQRLRGGVLQGAHDHALLRGTGGATQVVGVHFRPGGAAALLGGVAIEASNRCVALADLPGNWALLREQLLEAPTPQQRLLRLEAALSRQLHLRHAAGQGVDAAIAMALHAFAAAPTLARIDRVRDQIGLGASRFIERFRQQVGLTPKRYTRVLRFNRVLAAVAAGRPLDWVQLALDGGYSDQAHLANEFRRLAGLTPTSYRPVAPDQAHHVALP